MTDRGPFGPPVESRSVPVVSTGVPVVMKNLGSRMPVAGGIVLFAEVCGQVVWVADTLLLLAYKEQSCATSF